jgi:hypothetical protein
MGVFYIFLGIYLLSLLIVGTIHWAKYQDEKGATISMVDKVMQLYIIPFCPAANTFLAVKYIGDYLDNM